MRTVAVGVEPEGSGALPFRPKNHSKVGEILLYIGSDKGGFLLGQSVAEQISEYTSPAVLEPKVEMATDKLLTDRLAMRLKSTVENMHRVFHGMANDLVGNSQMLT